MNDARVRMSFGTADAQNPLDMPASVRRVSQVVLPLRVGRYFATQADEPVLLVEYATTVDRQVVQEECEAWARLGTDGGFELCADRDGAVRAVLLDWEEDLRSVTSSPEAFAQSLTELNQGLQLILTTDEPQRADQAYTRLGERLRSLDPEAFAQRENWSPLVLDDIRDTASAEWFTAFEILNGQGEKQIVTEEIAAKI